MHPFLALLALLLSTAGWAQMPEKPIIARVIGQPVTASWTDGRIAELRFFRDAPTVIPVPFKVSENRCTDPAIGIGQTFEGKMPIRVDKLGWFWRAHSNSAKVGQPLQFSGPMRQPLITFALISNTLAMDFPDLVTNFPKDEFIFGDLSWLPGLESGLREFTVRTWLAEGMVPNSQTGANENRITGTVTDITFSPISPNTVAITQMGVVTSISTLGNAMALVGDVVTWMWRLPNGEVCPISFKPNLAPANQLLNAVVGNNSQTFLPWLHGQDSLDRAVLNFIRDENVTYAD